MGNTLPDTAVKTPTVAPAEQPLGEEAILTTHRVFEAFDREKKGVEFLHADLFDSRTPVALSALSAVGKLADASSYPHVARLLASEDEERRRGAIRALGLIPHPEAARALLDLLKTVHGEATRCDILDAMAGAHAARPEALALAREMALSSLVSAAGRVRAAKVYLALDGERALESLLPGAREEIIEQMFRSAEADPGLLPRLVRHFAALFSRLHAKHRVTLTALAAPVPLPQTRLILTEALSDAVPEVRRAAYRVVGVGPQEAGIFGGIVGALCDGAESIPTLEDEAEQAIARLEHVPGAAGLVPTPLRAKVWESIRVLFAALTAEGRKVSSDSHELGWIISRSTEYLEYYGNEELRGAFLKLLKGSGANTPEEILRMLKASAARVEIRHFDGYAALADLAKNPKRSGAGLVLRELSLVKFGKGRVFAQLIRAIRLSMLFLAPGAAEADAQVLKRIWNWALQSKLYHLAEAARAALSKIDVPWAITACRECLVPPLASKILAIASLQLLRELSPDSLEPTAIQLLGFQDDPYVTLNVMEALSCVSATSNGELVKILLARLRTSQSREVVEKIAAFLGEKSGIDILGNLKELYRTGDDMHQDAVLLALDRQVSAGPVSNRDGTVELLYGILRGEPSPVWRRAAVLLWKIGDDYALKVIGDSIRSGSDDERIDILRCLKGSLTAPTISVLAPLSANDNSLVQEALRELLLSASGPDAQERVLEYARRIRGPGTGDDGADPAMGGEAQPQMDFHTQRNAFRFEREHIRELAVLFTDIVGYTKKAQELSPMQLTTLIREYESILIAVVDVHEGELVKRMGDGHLFVFVNPLNAVLAAIRLQKSLRRFNRYRDERARVLIRIGAHWGKLVRKDGGDILGNTVNIASRLESAAPAGSILISDQLHGLVKGSIHVREIGHITVKNISEPIKVYEPYEVILDLPASLDPLRRAQASQQAPVAAGTDAGAGAADATVVVADASPLRQPAPAASPRRKLVTVEGDLVAEIARTFSALIEMCRKAEAGQATVSGVREEMEARWVRIRKRLAVAARDAT